MTKLTCQCHHCSNIIYDVLAAAEVLPPLTCIQRPHELKQRKGSSVHSSRMRSVALSHHYMAGSMGLATCVQQCAFAACSRQRACSHTATCIEWRAACVQQCAPRCRRPSACVHHHASIIMRPSSCILQHAPISMHPTASINQHASISMHPPVCIHQHASASMRMAYYGILQHAFGRMHPTAGIWQHASSSMHPTACIQ